ncbi:hypothetical protein KDRO_B07370 [Kluyveromyces lactis]|nr:hypothetical protein KDRO_B07370 [Kluyveromyces lactis]
MVSGACTSAMDNCTTLTISKRMGRESKNSGICKGKGSGKKTLTLKWGGRPYKDKNKVISIPENTMMVNGILVAKNRSSAATSGNMNIKELIVVNEGSLFKPKKKRQAVKKNDVKLQEEPLALELPVVSSPDLEIDEQELNEDMLEISSANSTALDFFSKEYDPRLDILTSPFDIFGSNSLTELFTFYVRETSQLFIVSNGGAIFNPFGTTLPQMAMENKTVLKLLAVLAGQHRKHLGYNDESDDFLPIEDSLVPKTYPNRLVQRMFDESLLELQHKLLDTTERFSTVTLACILILASIDIFFDQKQCRWKTHLYGAKGIILEKLKSKSTGPKKKKKIFYSCEEDRESFLTRWFMYLNVISLLSSPDPTPQAEIFQQLDFDFCPSSEKNLLAREELRDIQYTSGMEPAVLSYLAKVSQMVFDKAKIDSASEMETLLSNAIELDYVISSYLVNSEKERDAIIRKQENNSSFNDMKKRIQMYQFLRSTNLIFGLTGLLILRRRVMNLPQDTRLIKELLIRITSLLSEKVPLDSPAQSCLLLCIFCCGCELIDDSLVHLRPTYLKHLHSLCKSGISGAVMAKKVMEECWATKKTWWEVLKTKKQHICFAI